MSESEWKTRKVRIDKKLKCLSPSWSVLPYSSSLDLSSLNNIAVEEFPTDNGPADYALFVQGKLLGIIEAKKVGVSPSNVLEQAKRYSQGVNLKVGKNASEVQEAMPIYGNDFKVPFLYATNGEVIWFADVRTKNYLSREISNFHTPDAIYEAWSTDKISALEWLSNTPPESNGDIGAFADDLPKRLKEDFRETMQVLRDPNFQNELITYKRASRTFIVAPGVEDTVTSRELFKVGNSALKPEDYLVAFRKFVFEHINDIEALQIVIERPKSWCVKALSELREKLKINGFSENNLQKAHEFVNHKALADIISIVKKGAREEQLLLTAEERVRKVFGNDLDYLIEEITYELAA